MWMQTGKRSMTFYHSALPWKIRVSRMSATRCVATLFEDAGEGPYTLERMGPGEYGFFVNGVCEVITPTLPQLLEAVVDGVRVREIIGFDEK